MNAAELEERARELLSQGLTQHAYETAAQALAEDPTRESAAELLVEAGLQAGAGEQVVIALQNTALADPNAVWAWALMAQAAATQVPTDLEASDRAASVNQETEIWPILESVRYVLRRAALWHELVRHLTFQADVGVRMRDQAAIYDELAEILSNKLSDPLTAREMRTRANTWRNGADYIAGVWKDLENHAHDAAMWDAAERFFRENELWVDLAQLLEASLDGASIDERRQLWAEIVSLHDKMDKPDWLLLDKKLTDASSEPALAGILAGYRTKAQAHHQAELASRKPTGPLAVDDTPAFPVWLLGLVAAVIGMGITLILSWRFLL